MKWKVTLNVRDDGFGEFYGDAQHSKGRYFDLRLLPPTEVRSQGDEYISSSEESKDWTVYIEGSAAGKFDKGPRKSPDVFAEALNKHVSKKLQTDQVEFQEKGRVYGSPFDGRER